MDRSQLGFDQNFSGAADDFPSLLRRKGLLGPTAVESDAAKRDATTRRGNRPRRPRFWLSNFPGAFWLREIAVRLRVTPSSTIVRIRFWRLIANSIMAIAGVPATAWEMARVLEHSLQYFRRTQLQEMSVDGKVRALSKLLRDNFGFVMQGVGVVVPIFATYDGNSKPGARLYFYDAMGAQFEAADYAATGSGSPAVRGILYYENTWGAKPLHKLSEQEAVSLALRALDTAAESDTATAGVDRSGKIYPVIKIVSREGITTLPESKIAAVFKEMVA